MDNQHKKITGYRDLSQEEIDMMNVFKNLGAGMQQDLDILFFKLNEELESINTAAQIAGQETPDLVARYESFREAYEWAQLGRKNLQTGLMQVVRSIARPESF
jgi:hypothetical protein